MLLNSRKITQLSQVCIRKYIFLFIIFQLFFSNTQLEIINKKLFFPFYSTNSLKLSKTINTSQLKSSKNNEELNKIKKLNANIKFNQNIKAYIDVCCRSDKLVIF